MVFYEVLYGGTQKIICSRINVSLLKSLFLWMHLPYSSYWFLLIAVVFFRCQSNTGGTPLPSTTPQPVFSEEQKKDFFAKIPVGDTILVSDFFPFLQHILEQVDSTPGYPLTEPVLLRANPWILDRLVATDYDYRLVQGQFVYDQRKLEVLYPSDSLLIPTAIAAKLLQEKIAKTRLDINIPAFELRILEGDSLIHLVKVRVGKNEKKYLEMAKTMVDLRTHTGTGAIFRINKNPVFYDPVDMKIFKETKRDDQRKTKMPLIPWLEPEINGIRYGQLIHPTTNPKTLGKPASNGCIGASEADAWRIFFYAPIGTPVHIRYELKVLGPEGDTIQLKDIYPKKGPKIITDKMPAPKVANQLAPEACWCEEHQS